MADDGALLITNLFTYWCHSFTFSSHSTKKPPLRLERRHLQSTAFPPWGSQGHQFSAKRMRLSCLARRSWRITSELERATRARTRLGIRASLACTELSGRRCHGLPSFMSPFPLISPLQWPKAYILLTTVLCACIPDPFP